MYTSIQNKNIRIVGLQKLQLVKLMSKSKFILQKIVNKKLNLKYSEIV